MDELHSDVCFVRWSDVPALDWNWTTHECFSSRPLLGLILKFDVFEEILIWTIWKTLFAKLRTLECAVYEPLECYPFLCVLDLILRHLEQYVGDTEKNAIVIPSRSERSPDVPPLSTKVIIISWTLLIATSTDAWSRSRLESRGCTGMFNFSLIFVTWTLWTLFDHLCLPVHHVPSPTSSLTGQSQLKTKIQHVAIVPGGANGHHVTRSFGSY